MNDELDLAARQLCSDGNCTGVLGDDGRCRECGRGLAGEPAAPTTPPAEEADAGFDDRRLCPDEACIGLVGEDGSCRICGTSTSTSTSTSTASAGA